MTKTFNLIALALILSFVAFAQTTVTSTTLSAAVTATQGTITVASATGFNAPSIAGGQGGMGSPTSANYTVAFVDKEAMQITAVNGTVIAVLRGAMGTAAVGHASSAKVWVQPARYYKTQEPSGTCNASQMAYLPVIVASSPAYAGGGTTWNCTGSPGVWVRYGVPGVQGVGANIASATTIAPVFAVTHITGTTTVATITVPPGFPNGGQLTLIPDGAWATTASGGNIAVATTGVVSQALIMTYDSGTAKWYPSYK